jgi:signal transduction histidine kinase
MAIAEDVTEAGRAEQQFMHEKVRTMRRLVGGVAHDFYNILQVIIGYAELIEQRFDLADRSGRSAAEIKRAAQRATFLTHQLLTFSKRQARESVIIDLNAVIEHVCSTLRGMVGEDVELEVWPGSDLGAVRADPSQIEHILVNLVVNARDERPAGGKLVIRTANVKLDENFARHHIGVRAGRHVLMSVSNTGQGVNADDMPHIFEPLVTTKEHGNGKWPGLSTVYGIVQQSGGFICIYSEPGKGATFEIYLPRLDQPAAQLDAARP